MSSRPRSLASHFDELYAASDDPWGYRTRWYEVRKRAVLMASLPRERYARIYEPGCGNGALSAELATRCDALLATDSVHAAVAQARRRHAALAHVRFEHAVTPWEWPAGAFDLVVVSELGYYLGAAELDELVRRSIECVGADGTLVACHWRHRAEDQLCTGEAVQARFADNGGLTRLVHHEEPDFILDAWCRDGTSPAARDGLA